MEKKKVVIVIRGGTVSDVFIAPDFLGKLDLTILDYDNIQIKNRFTKEEQVTEGEISSGELISIF